MNFDLTNRRLWMRHTLAVMAACCAATASARATTGDGDWRDIRDGSVVLFRHANAPGVGDPPGMQIGDCKTQRNLDHEGREQARRIGLAFRERGIDVRSVLHSQWCRARDTAQAAFPGLSREEPAFNSFFVDRAQGPRVTAAARAIIDAWRGPGVLVVVTHQVNIAAITGQVARPAEGIVMRRKGKTMDVVGGITL